MLADSPLAAVVLDQDAIVLAANAAATSLLGRSEEELLGLGFLEHAYGGDASELRDLFKRLVAGRINAINATYRWFRQNGDIIGCRVAAHSVVPGTGAQRAVVMTLEDVSAHVRADEQRRDAEELNIQRAVEGIITIDEHSTILFASESAEQIFGYTRAELVGQSLTMLMPETLRPGHLAGMRRFVQTGRKQIQWDKLEFPGLHKNGQEIQLEMSIADVGSGEDRVFTGLIRDVTTRRQGESALVYQALHDALTDLPNRNLLHERLTRAVLAAHRHSTPLALVFMDLDRFKDVNDSVGHHAGDLLLQQVAQRLMATVPEPDTVARLGGDEFAVLLPTTDDRGAAMTAKRILDALKAPFTVEGQSFRVGGSIGIAMYPQHGGYAATLMRRADVAMYAAKRTGAGFTFYTEDDDPHAVERRALSTDLRSAIAAGQLVPRYQSRINLHSGAVEGIEALVRWQHPERGLLPPATFIPAAEQSGAITYLTEWVIAEALKQCRIWHERGLEVRVAVNLSARSLQDLELVPTVERLLGSAGVAASWLQLELTPSGFPEDPDRASDTFARLHALSCRLSMDDFGAGYSSLANIHRFHFDEINIHKSFVFDMATNRDRRSIVRSVIDLGHNFGLRVVAEGVEDQQTLDVLGQMGCDLAQGYYVSPPMAADACTDWLEHRHAHH